MHQRWFGAVLALFLAFAPASVHAQERGFEGACAELEGGPVGTPCYVAAQAARSVAPQVALLLTGGNPTIGTASTGGFRLRILPGVSATAKVNLYGARMPDLREVRTSSTDAMSFGQLAFPTVSLSATGTVAVLPGSSIAPTVGGIGAVDLLASATWVPLHALGDEGFHSGSAQVGFGAGARLGILRESFTTPGVALSLMYHRLGTVEWGEACPDGSIAASRRGPGYTLEEGTCFLVDTGSTDPGTLGDFAFDLSGWSSRLAVSRHLRGLGLSAAVGYDRFSSDAEAGARAPGSGEIISTDAFARVRQVEFNEGRWMASVGGSYSVLVTTFAAELGWMQGGDALRGYPASVSDFEPGDGIFFGSLGIRVAL